jgi:hypothetical protein
VKYTTSYDLNTHDDGQVYLVLQDYHLDLEPGKLTTQLDNLFNGIKLLGEKATCVLENTTTAMSGYCNVSVCLSVSGDEMNRYINDNWDAVMYQVGRDVYDAFGLVIHKIFKESAKTVPYKDIFNDTE